MGMADFQESTDSKPLDQSKPNLAQLIAVLRSQNMPNITAIISAFCLLKYGEVAVFASLHNSTIYSLNTRPIFNPDTSFEAYAAPKNTPF
jgi:hypothetical protein